MNRQNIEIKFTSDNKVLKGMLHLPETNFDDTSSSSKHRTHNLPLSPTFPLIIGSHGLEGSMESAKQKLLAKILPASGFAFLRFDHRGCGNSEGDFVTDTSLAKRVEDIVNAIEYAISLKLTGQQIFLFGSSIGGSTCISAWSTLVDKGITPFGAILCAAPVNSLSIKRIPFNGNDRRPALPLSFFEDNLLFDLTNKLNELSNILIFHGDQDKTVPVENGYTLYENVKEPKKLIILNQGDHQMSNSEDQQRFEAEVIAWVKKTFTSLQEVKSDK